MASDIVFTSPFPDTVGRWDLFYFVAAGKMQCEVVQ